MIVAVIIVAAVALEVLFALVIGSAIDRMGD